MWQTENLPVQGSVSQLWWLFFGGFCAEPGVGLDHSCGSLPTEDVL